MDMLVNSAGQYLAFHIAADGNVVLSALRICDSGNILLDDRTLVEISGNVMRRSADQLHATLESLFVGVRALEGRQE